MRGIGGIEGYRGVLAGGYAPMPLIPMGIASWRKDAHTPNTHGHLMSARTRIMARTSAARHPAGPVLRCSMASVRSVSVRIVSVLTTRRGGEGGRRRPPGQGPRRV